jgi:hypothetical protein
MKTCLKKPLILPLLLALAVAPVSGQPVGSTGNTAIQAEAAPLPVTNAPFAATNNTPATVNKPGRPADDASVSIGPNGIHIGGANPVDIGGPRAEIRPFMEGLIAIVAIIMPFLFILVFAAIYAYSRHRKNVMLHETLRAMVEKGVPIPPDLLARPAARMPRQKSYNDLRGGLVMLGIGVGVVVLAGKVGFISIFIGVALLLVWFIERKNNGGTNDAPTNKP